MLIKENHTDQLILLFTLIILLEYYMCIGWYNCDCTNCSAEVYTIWYDTIQSVLVCIWVSTVNSYSKHCLYIGMVMHTTKVSLWSRLLVGSLPWLFLEQGNDPSKSQDQSEAVISSTWRQPKQGFNLLYQSWKLTLVFQLLTGNNLTGFNLRPNKDS